MAGNREGIHVLTRQGVVLNQVVRVVQMPPDIRIGDTAAGQHEDDGEDEQGQHDQKRNGWTNPLAPIRSDRRWAILLLRSGCDLSRLRLNFHEAQRPGKRHFNLASRVHRHTPLSGKVEAIPAPKPDSSRRSLLTHTYRVKRQEHADRNELLPAAALAGGKPDSDSRAALGVTLCILCEDTDCLQLECLKTPCINNDPEVPVLHTTEP